jgi:acylphosphatase
VIGNAVRAVAERIPAHVVGDGVHTIEQLVASKNEQRRRNPYIGANLIKLTPMTLHKLALAGMSQLSVPEAGQDLQLHSTASIGLGGEARDVSDLLHAGFSVIADKVRKAMYDPLHIGIDLIAEDVTLSPEKQTWAVVGVNANPEFGMHQFNSADLSRDVAGVAPEFGVHQFRSASLSRDVAGALIEAVFPEAQNTSIPNKSIRVLIEGKVQDPGFRDWVWRHAHLHMLGGWVRSRKDGRVEALFSGASNAVDQMIKQCGDGPKGGVVTKVDTFGDVP